MTNPRPYLPNPLRAAEMIKADLAKAGIPVEIVPNEWGAHLSRTSHGEHEMALMGWVGDNGDADNFLYVLLDKDTATLGSALNICFWMNDDYHNLMIAARRELDPEKRAALYRKSQEIVFEEVPDGPARPRGTIDGLPRQRRRHPLRGQRRHPLPKRYGEVSTRKTANRPFAISNRKCFSCSG